MLERIADKWTLLVIDALVDGELRFSQLQERVGGVSQKMLTKTLRLLERDGLLTRRVHAVIPPRVDLRLRDCRVMGTLFRLVAKVHRGREQSFPTYAQKSGQRLRFRGHLWFAEKFIASRLAPLLGGRYRALRLLATA